MGEDFMELSYLKSSQEIDAFLLAASAAGISFADTAARIARQEEEEEAVVLGCQRRRGNISSCDFYQGKSLAADVAPVTIGIRRAGRSSRRFRPTRPRRSRTFSPLR